MYTYTWDVAKNRWMNSFVLGSIPALGVVDWVLEGMGPNGTRKIELGPLENTENGNSRISANSLRCSLAALGPHDW